MCDWFRLWRLVQSAESSEQKRLRSRRRKTRASINVDLMRTVLGGSWHKETDEEYELTATREEQAKEERLDEQAVTKRIGR